MKRNAVLALLLVCPASLVFCHEPSLALAKGELDISLYYYPVIAAEYRAMVGVDEYFVPVSIAMFGITSDFNFAYAGSIFLLEYGLLDRLSIGIRADPLGLMLHGLRDDSWRLYASVYARVNVLESGRLLMHITSECQVSPLVSVPKGNWLGDGLINLFNTLSLNLNLIDRPRFDLCTYLDLKGITSIVNTAYMADPFTPGWYLDLTDEELEGLEVIYGTTTRLALAVGLDIKWRRFLASFGVNIPVLDFSLNPRTVSFYLSDLGNALAWFSPCIFEFNWRWRFP